MTSLHTKNGSKHLPGHNSEPWETRTIYFSLCAMILKVFVVCEYNYELFRI